VLILIAFFCVTVRTPAANNADELRVLKFPERTSLGRLYWTLPASTLGTMTYLGALSDDRFWHKAGEARGIVQVPITAVLAVEASYDAVQHPQLLTAYGPDFFTALDFSKVETDDTTVAKISSLSGLKVLDLRDSDLSDQGLRQLSGCRKLEQLSLSRTAVTDKGLDCLPVIDSLQDLRLNGTKVTDSGLKVLQKFRQLEKLSITDCHITDTGVRAIAGLPEITDLVLDGNPKITAKGLLQLSQLKKLRRLCVSQTSVTASDLATIQSMREKIGSLKRLEVCGPTFTSVEVNKWRQALPRIKLVADQKGGRASVGAPIEDVGKIFAPTRY
jgi:hypothetical protein